MNKIKLLEDLITHHREKYFQGQAEISDQDFDLLEEELRHLDPNNKILEIVGNKSLEISNKIKHDKPMLSLDKTYDKNQLIQWALEHETISMIKYDGSACSLLFKNGVLVQAKTRGNGEYGENIMSKVEFVKSIPKVLNYKDVIVPRDCEIRGELFITQKKFQNLKFAMSENKLPVPSSMRNCVAGIIGRNEFHELCTYLSFVAFELIENEYRFKTEIECLNSMEQAGFAIPKFTMCNSSEIILEELEIIKKTIEEGEFLIDGIVFSYNSKALQDELGVTNHHPKFRKAFKFLGEKALTKIQKISWGISRLGILTPVAEVEPVNLSNSIVSRVSLHNYGIVLKERLKSGDVIEITRSGEVIPKFLKLIKVSEEQFEIPEKCPSCNSMLEIQDIWLKCDNKNCTQKIIQEISFFLKVIGIEDLSEKRILELFNLNLLKSPADIFLLSFNDFLKMDKVKETLANKLYVNIQSKMDVPLNIFIASLGVEGLGLQKIDKILNSKNITNVEEFFNLQLEELLKIEGFAEISSKDILQALKDKISLKNHLLKVGIRIRPLPKRLQINENFMSKNFCLTGTLSKKREEIELFIKDRGGKIQSSVNKDTNYLITNDIESNSSKFIKAKKLQTPILTEDELFKRG